MADENLEFKFCHDFDHDGSYKTMVKFPRYRDREDLKQQSLFISEDGNFFISHIGTLVHNEDGPAIVKKSFLQENVNYRYDWVVNGKYHRLGEPAIVRPTGQSWWQYGYRHRYDGPAIEYANGSIKEWWVRGNKIENIAELLQPHELNPNEYRNWTDAEKIMVRFVLSS